MKPSPGILSLELAIRNARWMCAALEKQARDLEQQLERALEALEQEEAA